MMLELFGTPGCRFTADLRDDLEFDGRDFVDHDVDADPDALARMLDLTDGQRTAPVLVEDGRVVQIGVGGRGCAV